MSFTIFIGTIAAVLLLIFALFTLSSGKNSKLSNWFLAIFLLSNSLLLIDIILPDIAHSLAIDLTFLEGIGIPFWFLFGPTLFLFTQSITNDQFIITKIKLLHLLPFVISLLILTTGVDIAISYFILIFNAQVFIYLISCILVINKYRNRIKSYYSSIDKINFSWLLYIIGAFMIMWFIDFVNYYLSVFGINTPVLNETLELISICINLVFIVIIFYKALQEPQFLYDQKVDQTEKYHGSNLTNTTKNIQLEQLQNFFVKERPYLDPRLTIADVSLTLEVPVKHLSQIINELLDKNFYDFTNSFRIEFAKELLIDQKKAHLTILEILYNSGFNSKSAFNTAFKKHTALTPSEFRNRNTYQ